MEKVFFPSCHVTRAFPEQHAALRAYLKEKLDVNPIGCCRPTHKGLKKEDCAIVICNTCAAVIEESSPAEKLEYVWEIIDNDQDFVFPDYKGEKMTIQDCWTAGGRTSVQLAVRSLLKKMNIEIVEQEENFDKSCYCGTMLLRAVPERNSSLAPKRFLERGKDAFRPMDEAEQDEYLKDHCSKISTEKVVTYCRPCTAGINAGGKKGIHIIELLFSK